MRYILDLDGYVHSVSFGCYLDKCTEYTGTVPVGYNSLDAWATYACINAYYIDSDGNLAYDAEREKLIREKEAQDATDNAVLKRKDLYESEAVLDSQYIKATASGEVILLDDIKPISPLVRITGVDASCKNLAVYTHGKNMMPNNARNETISGVTFSKAYSGAITASGVPTANIEYTVAGSASNTVPLFALKKSHNYYLNLGGLECELRYYDGETTKQQYVGPSGLLNLPESIEVTQVVVKIVGSTPLYPSDTLYPSETLYPVNYVPVNINTTFMPQLEYGKAYTSFEAYKLKSLEMDFSDIVDDGDTVDYIQVENGVIYISVDGIVQVLGSGNVGLYSDYDMIYATKDSTLEMTYSTNVYDVDSLEFLQGKATTTNKFRILKDGSIEAHNGYFSGTIESNNVKITGGDIDIDKGNQYDFSVVKIDSNPYGKPYAVRLSSDALRMFYNGMFAEISPAHLATGTYVGDIDGLYTRTDVSVINNTYSSVNNFRVNGELYVVGTKSRLANTENYGDRLLYCYETPSPMFGDIGEGQLDDTGKCYVFLDDMFAETIDTDCVYQVFLQPYGDGKCYVSERTSAYFVVCGTAGMEFGWEIKATQKAYDTVRLEEPAQEEEADAVAEVLNETSNYLNTLLYNVESEVF